MSGMFLGQGHTSYFVFRPFTGIKVTRGMQFTESNARDQMDLKISDAFKP
jgi:hypothetical protein